MTTAMNTTRFARKTMEKRRRYIVKMVNRILAYLGNSSGSGTGGDVEMSGLSGLGGSSVSVAFMSRCVSRPTVASSSPLAFERVKSVSVLEDGNVSASVALPIDTGRFASASVVAMSSQTMDKAPPGLFHAPVNLSRGEHFPTRYLTSKYSYKGYECDKSACCQLKLIFPSLLGHVT